MSDWFGLLLAAIVWFWSTTVITLPQKIADKFLSKTK